MNDWQLFNQGNYSTHRALKKKNLFTARSTSGSRELASNEAYNDKFKPSLPASHTIQSIKPRAQKRQIFNFDDKKL